MKQSTEQRFFAKVDRNGPVPESRPDLGSCWLWTGCVLKDGYGRFFVDGKSRVASRWAYEQFVGELAEGWEPDHLCRVRHCVNPSHMEGVPKRTNILRGVGASAQHAVKTHCPSGHPYDESNTLQYRGRRYCRACRTRSAATSTAAA